MDEFNFVVYACFHPTLFVSKHVVGERFHLLHVHLNKQYVKFLVSTPIIVKSPKPYIQYRTKLSCVKPRVLCWPNGLCGQGAQISPRVLNGLKILRGQGGQSGPHEFNGLTAGIPSTYINPVL